MSIGRTGRTGKPDYPREPNDFYATEPCVTHALLDAVNFEGRRVSEPACGDGAIATVLMERGIYTIASDLVDRGYGEPGIDFLTTRASIRADDVITNPPFKLAREFIERALEVTSDGGGVWRCCCLMTMTALQGAGTCSMIVRFLRRNSPCITVRAGSADPSAARGSISRGICGTGCISAAHFSAGFARHDGGETTDIDHNCPRCGKFGAWGYGVNLRRGAGRFYCWDHRPDESAPLPPVTPSPAPPQGSLL